MICTSCLHVSVGLPHLVLQITKKTLCCRTLVGTLFVVPDELKIPIHNQVSMLNVKSKVKLILKFSGRRA